MSKIKLNWKIIVPLVLVLAIIAVAICVSVMYALNLLFSDGDYERPISALQPERGSFLIDPETIIELLENGETDVFTPNLQQVDGEKPTALFTKPINWTQGEYLMIAETINQIVWKDTLDDWELYGMVFDLNCQDNPSGFEKGGMTYFKTILPDSGKKGYTVRDFFVDPKYTYVEWRGGANYPRPLFGWKRIDLDNLRINAEDALRIAEENGGKNTRLRFNNNCRIKLTLEPERYAGWFIKYRVDGLPKFEIMIDPYTGKIMEK